MIPWFWGDLKLENWLFEKKGGCPAGPCTQQPVGYSKWTWYTKNNNMSIVYCVYIYIYTHIYTNYRVTSWSWCWNSDVFLLHPCFISPLPVWHLALCVTSSDCGRRRFETHRLWSFKVLGSQQEDGDASSSLRDRRFFLKTRLIGGWKKKPSFVMFCLKHG